MTDVLQPKMAGSGGISGQAEVAGKCGNGEKSGVAGVQPSQAAHLVVDSRNLKQLSIKKGEGFHEDVDGPMGEDEVDALPESLRYNWFDFMCTFISIVTYIVDLVMDCVVAYYFYHLAVDHGIYHYWYFGLTTFFIVLPSLTMTGFSFRWYVMDSDNTKLPAVSTFRWIVRLLVLFLQIAPILRYLDSMRYGLLSRVEKCREERTMDPDLKKKHRQERVKWYTLMVYEDADATLLRLYESFMESAPQLVLQIYILIKDPYANRINSSQLVEDPGVDPYLKLLILVLSVTSSLVSLAWSLVVYHRSLRYTYPNKKNISLVGTLFQFLWHFCSITARVLALSLFASIFPKWIGPLCVAHWIVMSSWVIFQRTAACNTPCEEFLFALVLGAIYIFSFFNAKEEQTRYKYLLYFTFSFLENSALVAVWFWQVDKSLWYIFPALVGHYLAFFGGIMFMLCYYIWFHPTGIQMPFFKFLRPRRGGLGGRTEVFRADLDYCNTSCVRHELQELQPLRKTRSEGSGSRRRREEEADGGGGAVDDRQAREDLRATASSPDLIKTEESHGEIPREGRVLVQRSCSVPPHKQEFGGVRKLKYMGQMNPE